MDPIRGTGISVIPSGKKGSVRDSAKSKGESVETSDVAEISSEAKAQLQELGLGSASSAEDARMAQHLADVKQRLQSGAYDSDMVTDYIARALLARGDV